jgi:hypothetical protein
MMRYVRLSKLYHPESLGYGWVALSDITFVGSVYHKEDGGEAILQLILRSGKLLYVVADRPEDLQLNVERMPS